MNINYADSCNFKPIPAITPLDGYWQNGTWKFGMSEISAGASSQPSWIDVILKGNTALTLVNAKADSLEYLKLFGGTELLPETYIDSVTAEGKCEQRNLPEGYTELNYIETDGNEYIDINVSGNVTFLGTAQSTTDEPATSQVLFANGGAQAGRWFGVQSPGAGTGFAKKWGLGATATASTSIDGTTKVDFEITFSDVDGQYGTVNNETLTRTTSIPTQTDWIILAGNDIGQYGFIGKIWKLQAVQNNVLVRDLIPCKNSSNVVGMYDTVSNTFFTNLGTGDFTAGSDVTVPSPDNPMDIVCNNGVLKFGKPITIDNTRNYAYINATGSWAWSSDSYSIALPVTVGKKYRIIISSTDSSIVGAIFRYGFTDSDPDDFKQIEVTPSSVSISIYDYWRGTPQDVSDVEVTATHPYLIIQFAAAYAATVVSTYLTVTDQSIYTDGTTETVTDSSGLTATCQNLLSVGTYKDTQEILSGAVTRNIGIKVLDGTENIGKSGLYAGSFFIRNVVSNWGTSNNAPVYCTHFTGVTAEADYNAQGKCMVLNNAFNMWWGDNSTLTIAQFSAWLAQQYAQGTPVIVIYTLATATTESVTSQVLTKAPVTYSGSISGLTGTVVTSSHTTPTPTQPLQLNCNNGVVKVSPYGQIYVDGTTEKVEVFGKNLFDINTITEDIRYNDSGEIVSDSNVWSSDYIPVLSSTDYTYSFTREIVSSGMARINFFDQQKNWLSVTKATFTGGSEPVIITITIPSNAYFIRTSQYKDVANVQLELGSTATTYEPYFNGGTATAQDLYAVGTYKDVQSVLDGGVTRNVGIYVVTGQEGWSKSGATTNLFYATITGSNTDNTYIPVSTHFKGVVATTGYATMTNGQFKHGSGTDNWYFKNTNCAEITDWKQWLKDQYQAGTPVIVIYPKATATTESVTGQPLTIQAGTNIVEITQASIDNLPLEVKYKAGVTVTITEVQNAQLDNSVEVTIQ